MQKSALFVPVLLVAAVAVTVMQSRSVLESAGPETYTTTHSKPETRTPSELTENRAPPIDETAAPTAPARRPDRALPSFLPPEAIAVVDAILRGGPFAYRQDGSVFQNRERRLPARERGYYREYTAPTPGSHDRGARRLIAGGDPVIEFFYTEDHYETFRRFVLDGSGSR